MPRRFVRIAIVAFVALRGATVAAGDEVDFARQVKPILQERCYACHGALKQEAGLRLDAVSLMRTGGDSGAVVTPGDAAKSLLVERVSAADVSERMPPEGQPLSAEQIEMLRGWIAHGATPPPDDTPEADPREHWSFRLPQRTDPPPARDPAWNKNPIDRFLAAEHERQGLRPARPAEPGVLLRRLYLDLIGLPPSAEEVQAYERNPSAEAYAAVVAKLLASPQYGERWARHWMDVWRYSDWYGRRGLNDVRNSFPHIWRWRDWIVRSLNDDKGYDRMIVEMLAGDEVAPTDDDVVVATGYLARNFYILNYDQWLRDVVDHTGKAFLGLRMGCALCHDHKYDPISQREYFAMRAFFEPIEVRQDRVIGGPPLPKFVRYMPGSNASLKPTEAGLVRIYDDRQTEPTYLYRGGDRRDRFEGEPTVEPGVPAVLGGRLPTIEPVRLPLEAYFPGARETIRRGALDYCDEQIAKTKATLTAAQKADEPDPHAVATAKLEWRLARARKDATEAAIRADDARLARDDDADTAAATASRLEQTANVWVERIAVAKAEAALAVARAKLSDDEATKKAVTRAESTLAAAQKKLTAAETATKKRSTDYASLTPEYPATSTGRRTALASWIASKENPLTARVAMNNVWAWYFGKPLSPTVYDLGRGGGEPVHRALLDWLAVEFVESGWSFKHLHRLIVTSRAYQTASDDEEVRASNTAVDQANRYVWKFERRRMEAEVLRDSLLQMAGLLDVTLGGPDIANEQAATVYRRSLYFTRYPEDGGVMPFLEQFDPPDPSECYRRTESLLPQQALALENGELPHLVSRTLGERLWTATPRDEDFVVAALMQVLNRAPRADEKTACLAFLAKQRPLYDADAERRAAQSLVHALLSHHDLITIH